MADMQTNINVNIDVSGALANLKNLQREISAVQSSLARGSASQVAAARNLQQEFVNSINATGQFSATFKKVETTTEQFTRTLEKNKFSLGEYFRYAGGASKTFGRLFTSEMATIDKVARERVKTLQTQYIKLGRDATGAMQSVAVRPLVLDMENLETKTAMAAQRQQLFNQLLTQGSTNLLNFGKNTQWAGRQLMVGFTIPLSILGTTAAKNFMELEEQAIKFKKVYGDLFTAPVERDEALSAVQELGKEFTKYGVSIASTVGLAAEAAAAGFQGIDLQRQTTEATRLSILGQLDQQKALETTISLQNAFQMSSEALADSINFLNAVENQTVVSLDDITTAIPKVAPVIQQLGGDVKDLAFFLTAMKEGGINASEGANALKSGLASLINPTEKAAQMLGSLGINIRGIVQQNAGDLKKTVIDFALALDQLDPLQRAQAIEQLFGKFQFARLSTLFSNVIRDGNQASRVLELTAASASELAESANQELGVSSASAMNQFRAAVEDLQFALAPIGELFLKTVTPIINFAVDVLENFNNLDSGVKTFVINMIGLIGGIGPIALMTFGLLANGVANIIKLFTTVGRIFNRTGANSTMLGDQINYMTQQQLEAAAVAASLDSVHQTLTQRFTIEKTAVDQLTTAYQKMVQAQSSKFPGAVAAVAAAKPKKFATGGFVSGSGSGDIVPAMLTPGEFVVKKDQTRQFLPLLQAINNGQVPGFAKGGMVGQAQYETVFAHIGDSMVTTIQNIVDKLKALGKSVPKDMQDYIDAGLGQTKVRAYGGLGFETNQAFNEAMKPGGRGVNPNEFLQDFDKRGLSKWSTSLKIAGVKIEDVSDELTFFDKEIKQQIIKASKLSDQYVVTDSEMEKFVNNTLNKLRNKGSKLAVAFDNAKQKITELRAMPKQSQLREAGMVPVPGRAKYFMNPDDPSVQIKAGRGIKRTSRGPGGVYGLTSAQLFNDEAATTAQTKSESRRTRKIAKDTVNGYVNELERGKKRAAAAGKATANASTAATTQATQYRDPATGRFAKPPVTQPGIIAAPATRDPGFSNFGARLTQLSFAISAVTGITSMFGGTLGEVSGMLFGLSSAIFGLTMITELLAKTKLAEIVATKASTVAQNMGAAVDAATGKASLASLFTKGGGIGGMFKNLATGLGVVLRFLGPVGIGLSLLAIGIPLVVNAMEEQRKKIEGLGNTANLTADQLNNLATMLNASINIVDFGAASAAAAAAGAGGATEEQLTVQQQLLASEQFLNDFSTQIQAVATQEKAKVELVLKSLAIQLASVGFGEEQIRGIISAITAAAKRTDLNLEFLDINIITDPAEISKTATEISQDLQDAANKATVEYQVSTGEFGPDQEAETRTRFNIADPQLQTEIQTAAGSYASLLQALQAGFQNETIGAKQFSSELSNITTQIAGFGPEIGSLVVTKLAEKLGLEETINGLKNTYSGLLNVDHALALISMKAAGIDTTELEKAMERATKGTGKDGLDLEGRKELNRLIEEGTGKIEDETQAKQDSRELDAQQEEYNEIINQANEDIDTQIETLENQNAAYDILIANKFTEAQATEIAANSNIAAALAYAANQDAINGTTEATDALIGRLNTLLEIQGKAKVKVGTGGGGGGGRKSDYQQAIDKLKEERKEIANNLTAYSRLRDAGLDIGEAFTIAKDPILAAALATTKVGTAAWEKLLSLIKQTNAELQQQEIYNLLQERQIEIEVGASFLQIAPTLAGMGLALEDIQEIMSNPALAAAFVADLEDGKLDAEEMLIYLQQIEAMKQIEINLRLSTEEGVQDQFRELYGMAMDMVDAYERQVEDNFEDIIRGLETQMRAVEKTIAGIQEDIADRQREIELSFNRPIAALQEESSDLANDLAIIDNTTAEINKRYDEQQKALEQVSKINEKLIAQDQARLTIADALTQGNIADAAKAIQDFRGQQAQAQSATQQDLLNTSRQSEIDALRSERGMTREEIAQRQFDITQQIYQLEEQREIKLQDIQKLEDEIYNLQEDRLEQLQEELDRQNKLKEAELEKIRLQREAWEDALLAADMARINSEEYRKVLEMTAFLMEGMQKTWDQIKSKTIELYIREVIIPAGAPVPPSTGGGNSGGGGGGGTQQPTTPTKFAPFGTPGFFPGEIRRNPADGLNYTWDIGLQMWRSGTITGNPSQGGISAMAMGGIVNPAYMRMGGMLPYKSEGGMFKPLGTDTVPAMLTPGEYVIRRPMVNKYSKEFLDKINNGTFKPIFNKPKFNMPSFGISGSRPGVDKVKKQIMQIQDSVYNYDINVNVQSNADPDQIARAVMNQIRQVDSMRIRGNRF